MNKRWDAIIERMDKTKPSIGVELGVWKGQNAEQLLKALPLLNLIMVDRWVCPKEGDTYFQGSIKIARYPQSEFNRAKEDAISRVYPFKYRTNIIQKTTVEAAGMIEDASLDFCFIDADHSYEGCKADIKAWFPKVKIGSWACGHDYGNNHGAVKQVVDELFGDKIELSYDKTWFYKVV